MELGQDRASLYLRDITSKALLGSEYGSTHNQFVFDRASLFTSKKEEKIWMVAAAFSTANGNLIRVDTDPHII